MFARAKKKEAEVEDHKTVQENYRLALSSIDDSIQAAKETRQKARRVFAVLVTESK